MYYNKLEKALENAVRNPVTSALASYMGCDEDLWRKMLVGLAYATPYVSYQLPDDPSVIEIGREAVLPAAYDDTHLLLNNDGLPFTGRPDVLVHTWPYEPVVSVTYINDTRAVVSLGDWSKAVDVHMLTEKKDVMAIEWPDELHIRGDIDMTDRPWGPNALLRFAVIPAYSHKIVRDNVFKDDSMFTTVEKAGYIDAFFQAKDDYEAVAVLVLALYKLNSK